MKYYNRLDVYRTSNNEVSIAKQYAYSYSWWKYWTVDNGISIFNNTYYSQSTCKHQREALALIREPDLILYHTTANLTSPDEALKNEIKGIDYEIKQLENAIAKPRSRQSTNERRRAEIDQLKTHKQKVIRLRDYINNTAETVS